MWKGCKDFQKKNVVGAVGLSNVAETLINVSDVQGFPRLEGNLRCCTCASSWWSGQFAAFMQFKLCCCSLIMKLWMGFRTTQVRKLSMVWMVNW